MSLLPDLMRLVETTEEKQSLIHAMKDYVGANQQLSLYTET